MLRTMDNPQKVNGPYVASRAQTEKAGPSYFHLRPFCVTASCEVGQWTALQRWSDLADDAWQNSGCCFRTFCVQLQGIGEVVQVGSECKRAKIGQSVMYYYEAAFSEYTVSHKPFDW